MKESWENW